jgi:hypothetical protein
LNFRANCFARLYSRIFQQAEARLDIAAVLFAGFHNTDLNEHLEQLRHVANAEDFDIISDWQV